MQAVHGYALASECKGKRSEHVVSAANRMNLRGDDGLMVRGARCAARGGAGSLHPHPRSEYRQNAPA